MRDEEIIRVTSMSAAPRRLVGWVERVFAPRPGTETPVLKYSLVKALERGDQDTALRIWKSLDEDTRDEIRKGEPADMVKGFYWNAHTRKYDLPAPDDRGQFSRLHPRPEQHAKPAPEPERRSLALAPVTGTGFRHAVQRGQIIHAVIDGAVHHFKVYRWGRAGITGINRDGDVAAIAWSDVRWGVAAEAQNEHLAKSVTLDLYAMDPEQRAAYFKMRGDDL